MSDGSPETLWDRLRRSVRAWIDEDDAEVDDASLAFNLIFVAPVVLALVVLLRR
jgi:hypothetical protein